MRRFYAVFTILFLLSGCGAGRQAIRQISDENKKNFALADELSFDLYVVYPQISGAFEAAKDLLPPPINGRVKEIDRIMLVPDVKKISKKDRAKAIVLFTFLLSESAQFSYKAYAPGILNLLKIMGLL